MKRNVCITHGNLKKKFFKIGASNSYSLMFYEPYGNNDYEVIGVITASEGGEHCYDVIYTLNDNWGV